jgi:hypothetical protein
MTTKMTEDIDDKKVENNRNEKKIPNGMNIKDFTHGLKKLAEKRYRQNPTNNHPEALNPKSKESIKKAIEYYNFWYLIECGHCETLFLVEDSVKPFFIKRDKSVLPGKGNLPFNLFCPRCGTKNEQLRVTKRLRLRLGRKVKDNEFNPCTAEIAKNWELPREIQEEVDMLRDAKRLEKNYQKKKIAKPRKDKSQSIYRA